MHKSIKIPTGIGLLLFLVIIISFIIFFENVSRSNTDASGSIQPTFVQISNITDTSFTVSWITDKPTKGAIILKGEKISKKTYIENNENSPSLISKSIHSVSPTNLQPSTTYNFTIMSNGKKFIDQNDEFIIQTAPRLSSGSSGLHPIYGTILTQNNLPAEETLVYVTLNNSQTLSTTVKPSGTWLLPLNQIRNKSLTSYLTTNDNEVIHIYARSKDFEITAYTNTLNSAPVPTMILGKTYNFQKLSSSKSKTQSSTILGTASQNINKNWSVALESPKNNTAIPTNLPLIKGTGIPGKPVSVTLGISHPQSDIILIESDGTFRYTPKKRLSPGKQSVTISTTDAQNKPIAITHIFEVLKSGTQVLGDATASATITPTTTINPTVSVSTPSATPQNLIAQPPPQSGNSYPTIIMLVSGFFMIFISVLTLI